ncbi:RhuM family protein [Neisseria leonii]|uniref:RhuM family protein n=1 Tax=Neisseria leonii TaxID=2995413 RepID=A0A9X4IDA9_9NEIS|nr:RhuM family protein [Neisseria sp. 51.81]MDD9327506.1 virulence RhuM family protein [Neisseria sp. 51.81]
MGNPIEIYRTPDGQTQVEARFGQETVWLPQAQLSDTGSDNIGLHLKNIFAEQEPDGQAATEDFPAVRQEGSRKVARKLKHDNPDAVISVGYRVKSKHAAGFRIWVTGRLKDYLLKGYAPNRNRLRQNADELNQAPALMQKTAASPDLTAASGRGLVDIVSRYTQTF